MLSDICLIAGCGSIFVYFWFRSKQNYNEATQNVFFNGKSVLITGASSGLGRALAVELYKVPNIQLILASRDVQSLNKLCDNLYDQAADSDEEKNRPKVYPLDLGDGSSIEEFCRAILQDFPGGVDILFNNAGISVRGDCFSTTMKVHERLMQVNYFGQVQLTVNLFSKFWTVPELLTTKRYIVGISSAQGRIAIPYRSAYNASKHAFNAFFDCLKMELASRNIDNLFVLTVNPGYLKTDLSKNALTSSGSAHGRMDENQSRGMDPHVAARHILIALANERCELFLADWKTHIALWARLIVPRLYFYALALRAKHT